MKALIRSLVSMMAACVLACSAWASPVVSLRADPSNFHPSENVYLDIVISGLQSGGVNTLLGAFDLTLTYDPIALQLLPSGPSNFGAALGDASDPTQTIAGADNGTAGVLRLFEVSLLESSATNCTFCIAPYLEELQGDSFLLARLAFYVPGTTEATSTTFGLMQGSALFSDAFGNAITDVALQDHLTVAIPEPGAMLLAVTALLAALWGSRRKAGASGSPKPVRVGDGPPAYTPARTLAVLAVAVIAGTSCGGGDQQRSTPSATSGMSTNDGVKAADAAATLVNRQALALRAAASTAPLEPVIGMNFTGSTYKFNTGNPPPDSMGAVGPRHFVETINSRFAIYDKTNGQLVRQSTLDEFWQSTLPAGVHVSNPYSVGFPSSLSFDPRILYDSVEQRWYAVADANMDLMVAVSDGADPTQGWKGYQLDQHHTLDFDLPASIPVANLLADLNDESTVARPSRLLMQEFAKHITFTEPGAYLVTQVIEPNRRWGVLCRFPHPAGFIGGCNDKSRVVRREGNQFRVYDWPRIDFPTLGMDADNLYVATQFNSAFFVIPKAQLRAGTPPVLGGVRVVAHGPESGQTQSLVDLDRGRAERALAVTASHSDLQFIRIAELGCTRSPGCEIADSVRLTDYYAARRAAQPGAKRSGAWSHEFIPDESALTSNLVLINNEVHGVQTVCETLSCATNSGDPVRLRYFRVRITYDAAANSFSFALLDDILLPNVSGSAVLHSFYGSVAVNRQRQVVIGFTGSSKEVHAGSYAVLGQLDASGQHISFGNPILLKAGHNEEEIGAESGGPDQDGRNRLGDYSATTVDPADPTRFWTIQEWISGLDVWSTQVTEIRLQPGTATSPVLRVSATAQGAPHPPTTLKWNNVGIGDAFGDFNKGIAIPNGQFMITPNLRLATSAPRYPIYTAQDFPLGDGRNEATEGSFNFAEDPGNARFAHFQSPRPSSQLQYANLELSIVAGADCSNDTLTLGKLPPIEVRKIFPTLAARGCTAGSVFTGTVNLLNVEATGTGRRYNSADILDAMADTPWSLRFTYRSNAIVTLARLSLGVPSESRTLVGDVDNFHGVDAADTPPRSPWVEGLLSFISSLAGQGAGVGLDQGGADRPVGLTHVLDIPADARITSASLKFRAKGTNALVYNDGIYYNDTVAASLLLPVIALRDLAGREPSAGVVLDLQVDLARVPVRTTDTTQGPGGHWSAAPDQWRSLLGVLMRDRRLDLVFSDDLNVDYSELTVTYVSPGARPGDLSGDDLVDQTDLNLLMAALNTASYGPGDPRDLDGDGKITVLDARRLTLLCTRPRCAVN